jgi:hypothetical protein
MFLVLHDWIRPEELVRKKLLPMSDFLLVYFPPAQHAPVQQEGCPNLFICDCFSACIFCNYSRLSARFFCRVITGESSFSKSSLMRSSLDKNLHRSLEFPSSWVRFLFISVSLPLGRIQEIKRMLLVHLTHGLFLT